MGPPPATVDCPQCRHSNPSSSSRCEICNAELGNKHLDAHMAETVGWSVAVVPPTGAVKSLAPGTVLAGRYEILNLLGEGGMGTVYKARDLELDRLLALKVIRSEFAGQPQVLQRFKQELILARQVTHKNVIRIFDLGTHENFKFITMEYVEGQDLATILEQRRVSPEEAARIVRQVCLALDAAHSENVIHRDLKPPNVMVDASGRVRVMDFGLARSVEMSGLTQTGALLGTPAYMSPEQAKAAPVDTRSDLFSLGVIFYELLTCVAPFKADTAWASLLKRTQEPAAPPSTVEPSIPKALDDIVMKCLAIDPDQRYQTAAEMVADLNVWLGDGPTASVVLTPAQIAAAKLHREPRIPILWRWVSVGIALLIAAGGGWMLRTRFLAKPKAAHAPVTVLVADFDNHTGDPIFDNTLEPMFNTALEGASFINGFNRGQARRLAGQLPHPTQRLDEQSARLLATSQGLGAVITGSLSRRGDGYKISVEAMDAVTGNTIANAEATAPNKDAVLLAVPKLAAPIRKALGDTMPESAQLAAAGGGFTVASLEAVHLYGLGMEQQFAGKMEDALRSFQKAAELDPNFARAYCGSRKLQSF